MRKKKQYERSQDIKEVYLLIFFMGKVSVCQIKELFSG